MSAEKIENQPVLGVIEVSPPRIDTEPGVPIDVLQELEETFAEASAGIIDLVEPKVVEAENEFDKVAAYYDWQKRCQEARALGIDENSSWRDIEAKKRENSRVQAAKSLGLEATSSYWEIAYHQDIASKRRFAEQQKRGIPDEKDWVVPDQDKLRPELASRITEIYKNYNKPSRTRYEE